MLKSETREIGGRKFAVTQLGTEEGLRIFFKIGKLIGPSIAELLREWQGQTITKATLGAALAELCNKLEYRDFLELVTLCAKCTSELVTDQDGSVRRVGLEKTISTVAFAGDYLSLLQWLGFCLELNFASFFVGLGLTKLPNSADQESA